MLYKQAEKIKSNKKTEYILAFQKMSVYLQRSSYIQASEARYQWAFFMSATMLHILRLSNSVWSVNAPTACMVMNDGKWIAVSLS